MSRKYQRNDFEKRWIFSRRRKGDNDSADVRSAGKSFQSRVATAPTTGKARLATGDSHGRYCQTASVGRAKRSTAMQISDAIEWSEGLRREFVQDLLCQDGNIEPNSLDDPVLTKI